MTDLSPAAQAVLNAAEAVSEYGKATPLMKARLAAALRAAADQVAPSDAMEPRNNLPMAIECQRIRSELLAIAAELVDAILTPNPYNWEDSLHDSANRARTLLAQPVAEGPTDDEIEEWADACSEAPLEEMDPEVHGWRRCFTAKEFSETIRAALARFGRPTPQPVAVSERLPEPEDCIKRGNDHWCWGQERSLLTGQASARWRLMRVSALTDETVNWLPANALPTPEATNESPN